MEGYICDRCGAPVGASDRAELRVSLENVKGPVIASRVPLDVCPACERACADIIAGRILTKHSRRELWDGLTQTPPQKESLPFDEGEKEE